MAVEQLEYRVARLEESRKDAREDRREMQAEIQRLSDRIDKLTLTIFGGIVTLAVFGLGIAVTLLTAGSGG